MEGVTRAARVRRVLLFTGVMLLGMLVWTMKSSQVSGQTSSGGYRFSIVDVSHPVDPQTGEADTTHARVRFRLAWATPEFPGERLCTWRVYDAAGALVGETAETIVAAEESYDQPAYNDVAVAGDPAHADVSCAPGRLDDPAGHFRVSDARVTTNTALPTAEYAVVFDARWEGAGTPTPQECTARLYGKSGGRVHEETRNLISAETAARVSLQLEDVPSTLPEEPTRAVVTCRPLH